MSAKIYTKINNTLIFGKLGGGEMSIKECQDIIKEVEKVYNAAIPLMARLTENNLLHALLSYVTLRLPSYKNEVIFARDKVYDVDKIVDSCLDIRKLTEGCVCTDCPNTLHGPHYDLTTQRSTPKKKILDYEYVSSKVISGAENFKKVEADDIDLSTVTMEEINQRKSDLSETAEVAARTRKYGKEYCDKCYYHGHCRKSKSHFHPCLGKGLIKDEEDIIALHYKDTKINKEELETLTDVVYASTTPVKVGRSNCYYAGLQKGNKTKVIKQKYPFNTATVEIPKRPVGVPVLTREKYLLYNAMKHNLPSLGSRFRILGHENFFLGIHWDGIKFSIRSGTSNHQYLSEVRNFIDLWTTIGGV
jgi:hypothetical protein